MDLVQRLDDFGKPAWITLMVLGFIVFWPIGLGLLAYLIWSGRMGCWHMGRSGWRRHENRDRGGLHMDLRAYGRRRASSGNTAFDEYREETLKRLEEEQKEFHEFLERLRDAKDKAEFDQFMADRRRRAQHQSDHNDQEGPQPRTTDR